MKNKTTQPEIQFDRAIIVDILNKNHRADDIHFNDWTDEALNRYLSDFNPYSVRLADMGNDTDARRVVLRMRRLRKPGQLIKVLFTVSDQTPESTQKTRILARDLTVLYARMGLTEPRDASSPKSKLNDLRRLFRSSPSPHQRTVLGAAYLELFNYARTLAMGRRLGIATEPGRGVLMVTEHRALVFKTPEAV